jgi:hypothetical protein
MDADTVAVAIAVGLHAANVKFRFKGEGKTLGPPSVLVWDTIVVEAVHPVTLEYHRLHTIEEAMEFLVGLG